ncbi:MAG: hypothetical protein P8Z75_02065 [Gammaproteobacteria bacterium]
MNRPLFFVLPGVGLLLFAILTNADAAPGALPDFRAEVHVRDRINGKMYTAKVAVSRYGKRSETTHPRYGKMIAIANLAHKTCRTYLVNKKAYYQEALDPRSPDCDLDLDRLFGEYADTANTYSYHVLGATKPCGHYKRRKLGEGMVNGRNTIKWECTDPIKQVTYTEWFDPQLGRVIKHEEARIVKEYDHIVVEPLAKSLFANLQGYRKYTQNSFFDLLRIPEFSTTTKKPTDMSKLLPNDRLQICMENCQARHNECNTTAKGDAGHKKCDHAFDQCASVCEKKYPPQ